MECAGLRAQQTNAKSLHKQSRLRAASPGGPFLWCECLTSTGGPMTTHRHLGADKVVRGETLQARDDINITPLVDGFQPPPAHPPNRQATSSSSTRPSARFQSITSRSN